MNSTIIVYAGLAAILLLVIISEVRFLSQKKTSIKKVAAVAADKKNTALCCAIADCLAVVVRQAGNKKVFEPELFMIYYKMLAHGLPEMAAEYKSALTEMLVMSKIREENIATRKIAALLEKTMFLLMAGEKSYSATVRYEDKSIFEFLPFDVSPVGGREAAVIPDMAAEHSKKVIQHKFSAKTAEKKATELQLSDAGIETDGVDEYDELTEILLEADKYRKDA